MSNFALPHFVCTNPLVSEAAWFGRTNPTWREAFGKRRCARGEIHARSRQGKDAKRDKSLHGRRKALRHDAFPACEANGAVSAHNAPASFPHRESQTQPTRQRAAYLAAVEYRHREKCIGRGTSLSCYPVVP